MNCSGTPLCLLGDDKRAHRGRAMVAAAKSLFLEKGFDGVSMTDVVRRSGGSLSTLYQLFGNKQGLLRAVVSTEQFEGLGRLRTLFHSDAPPHEILHRAACDLVAAMLDPEVIGLMRLVTAEGLRNPEFAANIQGAAQQPLFEELKAVFGRWDAAGEGPFPQPELSAHVFINLFFYAPQMRALFLDPQVLQTCHADKIGFVIDMFLAGCRGERR